MTGLLVLWLSKKKHGWVPEIEEGLGQLSPLPGTSGKPMRSLQRARLLAEAWVKAAHPMDAQLREAGMEWRDRAMSETQAVFCERHGIPYDPAWSRGTVNNTIDRYVVETMRLPATDRQLFITRHMSPYAPSYLVHSGSTALMYRQAADHLLQSLLTANFTRSTARPSKEALKAEAGAAAAAAAAAGGFASGVQQGSGAWDEVLPARKALVEDLDAQFEAGLRPRHTWLVISGQRLLLDLMSGSYLWLIPAAAAGDGLAAAAAAGVAADDQAAPAAAAAAAAAAESALLPANPPAAPRRRSRPRSSSSSSSSSSSAYDGWRTTDDQDSADSSSSSSSSSSLGKHDIDSGDLLLALDGSAAAAAAPAIKPAAARKPAAAVTAAAAAAGKRLDPSALYELHLELPDGSMHPIATAPAATALLTAYSAGQPAAAAAAAASSSSSSSSSAAKPLPLPAALARAERVAALLVTQQHAFLSREAAVRLAGMVGGWKVPSKASEQQPAMLATPRQLELLRAAGLPTSRRYSCLDAHRELLRHAKTHGLPELPATPSQLARMQELHIPIGSSSSSSAESAAGPGRLTSAASAESVAAGTESAVGAESAATANMLTSAEAKALLFRVQLAEERRQAEVAKQKGGKAKQGPIMAGVGGGFARRPRRHRA